MATASPASLALKTGERLRPTRCLSVQEPVMREQSRIRCTTQCCYTLEDLAYGPD